jgi:hypothetical protein
VTLRVVSYGGGVQSTCSLVLAVQGRIDYSTFLFASIADSENPATLRYVREVAVPAHGLTVHELHRVRRDGTRGTLYGRLARPGSRSLPIPVRMPDTGAPGRRACTADFKVVAPRGHTAGSRIGRRHGRKGGLPDSRRPLRQSGSFSSRVVTWAARAGMSRSIVVHTTSVSMSK